MRDFLEFSRERLKAKGPCVLAGDFNVIPAAQDVYTPAAWAGDALSLPQTRAAFQSLLGLGLTDALRAVTDAPGQYTFWDYQAGAWQKNHGLRIDHLLMSPQASDRLIDVGIDSYVRGWEKPSGHVPVWADLDRETAEQARTIAGSFPRGADGAPQIEPGQIVLRVGIAEIRRGVGEHLPRPIRVGLDLRVRNAVEIVPPQRHKGVGDDRRLRRRRAVFRMRIGNAAEILEGAK